MRIVTIIGALLLTLSTSTFAQGSSAADQALAAKILKEKSYHVDLPTYTKASEIVDRLISETDLKEQEIANVLDDMVADPATVTRQMLVKYHGLPILKNTGNKEKDMADYKKAKTKWVEENPEKYKELIESNRALTK